MLNLPLKELKRVPKFQNLPDSQLQWLKEHMHLKQLQAGEFLFEKGMPIENLYLILEGDFELYLYNNNNKKVIGFFKTYDITGLLPFSRATTASGYSQALTECKIAVLPKKFMPELVRGNYELTEVLVHEMNNRIRNFTQLEVQTEKLIALGKLSAGLAHELNNPISAMVRSASLLEQHLTALPADFKKVIRIKAADTVIDDINSLMYQKISKKTEDLSLMEKSNLEDDLYDWFSGCDLNDKYHLIPLLVEYQFNTQDLQHIKNLLREEDFNPVLKWIVQNITTQKTVGEIKEASLRIETLIKSVKSYTYMDKNMDMQLMDIQEGLKHTLMIFNHKLSNAGHHLITKFYTVLPKIKGFPGELNQVWTNIIDNAIDALPASGGELTIETKTTKNYVVILFKDNGHGIPEDVKSKIFEPFYTTKAIGEGTGLGLDIVLKIINQHNGIINVNSKPGETVFEVCLPLL